MEEKSEKFFICSFCGQHHSHEIDTCPASGSKIPFHHKLVGSTFEGKYLIEGIVGEGGMGVVYKARHTLIGRELAVKVLFPEISSNPQIVERFYNEARTAASIGNEHIIEITDMGFYEQSPFIVMEFLKGKSLADIIESKILLVEEATGIIIQVLDALHAVHSKGVIHRDLKPENIFLIEKSGRNDFVKILDFGISKLKTPEAQNLHLTRTGTVLGTPYYMAPEQAAGKKEQDHRIDIYATGVILFEMLTRNLPYAGDNYNALLAAILTEKPRTPREFNPELPVEIENIIMKAISKQPHQRYSNALEFAEALKPFAPSWAKRPSKIAGLISTSITGKSEVPPPPPPAERTQTTQSASAETALPTMDWSATEQPVRKTGRGKLVTIISMIIILIAGGSIAGFVILQNKDGGKKAQSKNVSETDITTPAKKLNIKSQNANQPMGGKKSIEANPIRVEFTNLPENATIKIDGKLFENPAQLKPSTTERKIIIDAPEYKTWEKVKILTSDTTIAVNMEKISSSARDKKKKKYRKQKEPKDQEQPKTPQEQKQPQKPVKKEGSKIYRGAIKNIEMDYPEE